ncbi:unnamed protein product [Darwinula stevensoni]|uniref:Uncharacterized protein n=1 Tax=Darwinula stevensoni TaxID=69355 RepID=A0A7R8X6H8_9CRUS|nr:unnamed protein product [Darwinula stevensoni]CAG0887630.1 unnamed protein product [Darwinula stevensoni]
MSGIVGSNSTPVAVLSTQDLIQLSDAENSQIITAPAVHSHDYEVLENHRKKQSEDGSGNSGMKRKDSSDEEEGCDCDQPAKEDVSEEYKSRSGSSSSNSPAPSPSVGAQWQHLLSIEERRQLLGTEEESSDRHSESDEEKEDVSIWEINQEQRIYYTEQFRKMQPDLLGLLPGQEARRFFEKSGLPIHELSAIWQLCDVTKDGALSLEEFCSAMHLVVLRRYSIPIPVTLPTSLMPTNITNGQLKSTDEDAATAPPKPNKWAQFEGETLSRTSSIQSPDEKPVNFDFQRNAIEKDPRIIHPKPRRIGEHSGGGDSSPRGLFDHSAGVELKGIQRPQPYLMPKLNLRHLTKITAWHEVKVEVVKMQTCIQGILLPPPPLDHEGRLPHLIQLPFIMVQKRWSKEDAFLLKCDMQHLLAQADGGGGIPPPPGSGIGGELSEGSSRSTSSTSEGEEGSHTNRFHRVTSSSGSLGPSSLPPSLPAGGSARKADHPPPPPPPRPSHTRSSSLDLNRVPPPVDGSEGSGTQVAAPPAIPPRPSPLHGSIGSRKSPPIPGVSPILPPPETFADTSSSSAFTHYRKHIPPSSCQLDEKILLGDLMKKRDEEFYRQLRSFLQAGQCNPEELKQAVSWLQDRKLNLLKSLTSLQEELSRIEEIRLALAQNLH